MGAMVIEYYLLGYYTTEEMPIFVTVGWITQEELDAAIAQREGNK